MQNTELFLLTGYLDDRLSPEDAVRLQNLLRESAAARQTLRDLATIDSRLTDLAATPPVAVELLCDTSIRRVETRQQLQHANIRLLTLVTIAACLVFIVGLQLVNQLGRGVNSPSPIPQQVATLAEITDSGVAVLVSAIDVRWTADLSLQSGSIVVPGELKLVSGLAEIEFYSGARLIVEGPAHLEIVSANEAICHNGKLRAFVPPPARGFKIRTSQFELVDLGTEFGMEIGVNGDAEVQVFDGEVELHPNDDAGSPQQIRHLLGGSGVFWNASGQTHPIRSEPSNYSSFDQIRQQSQLQSTQRYNQWQEFNRSLANDPRIAVRYDFEACDQGLPNARLPDSGESAAHGTIIGCEWTSGRWPDKHALEFRRPSDRVRVDIPGSYNELTLTAWIRVDANPGRHQGLLLTDGFAPGHPHWQIAPSGDLRLCVGGAKEQARDASYGSPELFKPHLLGVWSFVATAYDRSAGTVRHFLNDHELSVYKVKFDQDLTVGLSDIGNWGVPLDRSIQRVRNFVGRMDELTLWNVALDASEIRDIYHRTQP